MGEYPSLCVRNMHAVRMQCKNFPYVFFTVLGIGCAGGGGGAPKGLVHNLPMPFFTPGSSKIEVSENFFF